MKTKSYLIGLLLLAVGLFTIINYDAGAQNKNSTPAACIILGFTTTLGPIIQTETGGWYRNQTGLHVTWINRGPNAANIQITEGEPLGQAIEKILNNSFRKDRYEWLPAGNGWLVFVR